MMGDDHEAAAPAISELLTGYHELNGASIDELTDAPSPLEFMRQVARNRPFVLRNGAAAWAATRRWDLATLKRLLVGQSVNVAVTPNGRADAPTRSEDGELLFVKPWEEQQPFEEFVDYVAEQEKTGGGGGEVRYAQTQNDNLRNEYAKYATLFSYVEKDIPWARIALQNEPEAINLWIGNSRSVTALHKDNYENIYVQILGQKHFVLLPPLFYPSVAERLLPPATYHRASHDTFSIQKDVVDNDPVPFATWDPDGLETHHTTAYSDLAAPMRVTLNPGDILYLPAMWYHKVSQSCSEEGICCAVNYWHDMDFSGGFYPLCNFVRSVALQGNTS